MKTIYLLTALAYSSAGIAGAANALLSCKATNVGGSEVKIDAEIPGDFSEFELRLSNKFGQLQFSDADARIASVISTKHKVFTAVVESNDGASLTLYALPATFKATGQDQRLFTASFDALLLSAPRPGYKKESSESPWIRNVPLRCTLEHQI